MRNVFILFFYFLLSAGSCVQDVEKLVANERYRVSVITINLFSMYDFPNDPDGRNWIARYASAADEIAKLPSMPAIIALQEVPGWLWCPIGSNIADYEALHVILSRLNAQGSARYRIAYLMASSWVGSSGDRFYRGNRSGGCRLAEGKALLYREDLLRQVDSSVGLPYDSGGHSAPHRRNSLPCLNPKDGQSQICDLVDGPSYEIHGKLVKAGAAWQSGGGSTIYTRFELVNEPGSQFSFYNIHRWFGGDPAQISSFTELPAVVDAQSLISAMHAREKATFSGSIYPPILAGDFNLGSDDSLVAFPTFAKLAFGETSANFVPRTDGADMPDLVNGILAGKAETFQPKYIPFVTEKSVHPKGDCDLSEAERAAKTSASSTAWSDHCDAVFVSFHPS